METITITQLLIYPLVLFLIWSLYWLHKRVKQKSAIQIKEDSIEAGLLEPSSLHPIIDPILCLGCGTCIRACPEKNVLGLINGKSHLINPTHCIGHGACKTSCPFDAITLVLGTEKRGVDIPLLTPEFETHVPGIYIAGELGGMGLIRNAINQGLQAIEGIAKTIHKSHDADLDLLIVGAGPAGIAASLSAQQKQLNYMTIDQDSLGGTVAHYPRNKIVMTAPVDLPLVGKVKFKETSKEALLEFWKKIIHENQLTIREQERLVKVEPFDQGFKVTTSKKTITSNKLLLCLGRRGTPRKLGVEGEDLPKVVYRLIDAAQFRNQHVLIVGGGDSALEAAITIAEEPGTTVSIVYRGEAFSRAKPKNREKINASIQQGTQVIFNSRIISINESSVIIEHENVPKTLKNNAVIVCVGGILPTPFLKDIGISIETKNGTI